MTRARSLSRLANSQAFTVDSDLDVGINSTSPSSKLDVGGDIIVSGVVTATSFVGDVTGNADTATTSTYATTAGIATVAENLTGNPSISVTDITATGNVSIAGTLTYEDVANVDSIGIITARSGIDVTGGDINVGTATTITDGGINVGTATTITDGGINVGTATTITDGGINVTGVATATTFDGNLTGNVTGNVNGNVTGNVTGNITGNVTGGTIVGTSASISGIATTYDLVVTNSAYTSISTTDTNKTIVNREYVTVVTGVAGTNANITITLPASPNPGWEVAVAVGGTFLDTVVARNGSNIMALAEDITLDRAYISVQFVYVDAYTGWRFF